MSNNAGNPLAEPSNASAVANQFKKLDPRHPMPPIEDNEALEPSDFDDSFMLEPKKRSPVQSALSRLKRVFTKSVVHVAPIAITISVLSLTFMQKFWTAPSAETNTLLDVLQFAAQLHGSLVIMSLSSIVLHRVSTGLRSSRGISHGLLTSGFQLNSLSYLFRSEFRSAMTDTRFVMIFLSIFILAFACQPSSAIAMIPRLQYWPGIDIYPGNTINYHAYIQATEHTLYPNILTADNAPSNCSSMANASLLGNCPSTGVADILSQDSLFATGYGQPDINMTIDSGWRRQLIGAGPPIYQEIYSSYNARTLSNFLGTALHSWVALLSQFGNPYTNKANIQRSGEDLQARYDLSFYSGSKRVATKRPAVHVECAGYTPEASEITFPENNEGPAAGTLKVPSSQFQNLSVDRDSEVVNFTWIDVRQFPGSRPSLLALFGTPTIYTSTSVQYGASSSNPNYTFSLFGCKIDARWEQASAFYDDTAGSADIFDANPSTGASGTDDWIQVHPGFADYLNVPYFEGSITPASTNKSTLQAIGEKCIAKNTIINSTLAGIPLPDNGTHHVLQDPKSILQCFQVSLSAYIADALSRVQDSIPAYFVASGHANDGYEYYGKFYYVQPLYDTSGVNGYKLGYQGLTQDDFDDTTRFTELAMPLSRYGYGYGFADSKLIYVATVILLIHVAVCIIHIVSIVVKDPQDDMGWETLGELIAVLLRSPNAENGLPLLRTNRNWKDRIIVRAIEDDDKMPSDGRLSNEDAKLVAHKPSTLMMRRVPARSA